MTERDARHRRPAWMLAAPVVFCAVLAACTVGDARDPRPLPSPQESALPSPPSDRPPTPELGTCWDVPVQQAFRPRYWHDDSPSVSCSSPHTTETVAVVDLSEPDVEAADMDAADCWEAAQEYVGASDEAWIPWVPLMYLPSRADSARGATWMRCDVAFAADYPYRHPARHRHPASDAATTLTAALWACLGHDPRRKAAQPLVDCAMPHRFESTGVMAVIEDLSSYPPPRVLRDEAGQCRDGLTPDQRERGLVTTVRWDEPQPGWSGDLLGTCWAHRPDRQPLPPRR